MSRIDWGRRSGEEVETVVGILLRRRHRGAERITPSQGDSGLDVIVRDLDGWIVYQIKKHVVQPNASQKAKIKKSLSTLVDQLDSHTIIKSWHLVTPTSPTPPSLRWFVDMTESAPFACTWCGSDFLDGLAAEFPDVIDYYLRDGKDRLAAAIADLAEALQPPKGVTPYSKPGDESDVVSPTIAIGPVLAAHTLINQLDPHFQYDFSVDSYPPNILSDGGLVFAETRGSGAQYFTFRVYEKYRGALLDRPITGNALLRTPQQAERDAVRDFIDYGAPLELESGLATVEADLPGGLGGSLTGALRILPTSDLSGHTRPIRMRVIDESDDVEQEVELQMRPATSGLDGRNLRGVADDEGGAFSVECRYTEDDNVQTFQFTPHEISGKLAGRVAPGLRFLSRLRRGNKLHLAQKYGPYVGAPLVIPRDLRALIDERVFELVESIVVLQTLTSEQLVIPDLAQLTHQQGEEIVVAAKVLKGEEVAVYFEELEFWSNGSPIPLGDNALYIVHAIALNVNGVPLSVGPVGFHFDRVKLSLEQAGGGALDTIRARPVGAPKMKAVAHLLPPATKLPEDAQPL